MKDLYFPTKFPPFEDDPYLAEKAEFVRDQYLILEKELVKKLAIPPNGRLVDYLTKKDMEEIRLWILDVAETINLHCYVTVQKSLNDDYLDIKLNYSEAFMKALMKWNKKN